MEKKYYILAMSILLFPGVQMLARGEMHKAHEAELSVKIPDVLNIILFPFRKNLRVRVTLCLVSGYIEISNIVIYTLAALQKLNLDWEDVNTIWFMLFGTMGAIMNPIECVRDAIIQGRDRNFAYRLLAGIGCIIILMISIIWILIMMYILITDFK